MGWCLGGGYSYVNRSLSIVSFVSLPYRVHAEGTGKERQVQVTCPLYGCSCMFKRARLKDYSEKKTGHKIPGSTEIMNEKRPSWGGDGEKRYNCRAK